MKPVPKQFSFNGNPAKILLRRAVENVFGLEKIDLIYLDHTAAKLVGETAEIKGFDVTYYPLKVDLYERIGPVNTERATKKDFDWFENGGLPYLPVKKNSKNQELFDETKFLVLLVRIPNLYDGQKDLLFLFFDKEMKHFGLSKGDKVLSANFKTILEKSFVKLLIQMAADIYSDQEILANIGQSVAYSGKDIERLNKKIRETGERLEEMLEFSAKQYLEKYCELYDTNFFFTDGAITQIRGYQGKILYLENVIKNAVEIVINLMIMEPKSAIPISEALLNFPVLEDVEPEKNTPLEKGHYSLAVKFLDRLENAAISVKMRKLPLTSDNVAKAHDVPIKPPAITYGAKYHRDKIIYLLNNYPDKWTTIRNDFKPVRNVVEKGPDNHGGENKNAG